MTILHAIHICVALLLTFAILVQSRVAGLSSFGTSGAVQVQRRGAEKVLYQMTVWLAVVFFALGVVWWFVQ